MKFGWKAEICGWQKNADSRELVPRVDRLEQELAKRSVEVVSTENLYRLVALIRAEIRKVCQAPPVVEDAIAQEE